MAQKAAEESKAMAEGDLPALDDAFAQSIGYDDAKAFETALSANMQTNKRCRPHRNDAERINELAKESKIFYPPALRGCPTRWERGGLRLASPAQARGWNASAGRKRRMRNCGRVEEEACRYAR